MRLGFKIFFLLFVIKFTKYSCERISLIGSHLISTDLNYTAILLGNHVKNNFKVDVAVYDSEIIDKFDENTVEAIVFGTPGNIHPTKPQVSVKVNGPGVCKEQSVDLIDISKSSIIFIQFDKPIYKAGEVFRAHVFVLDRKMLPLKSSHKVSAYITDENDKNIGEDINLTENREFSVYEANFTIPLKVDAGLFNINVQVNNRKVSKSFQVQQQQRSDDEVFIEMQDTVAFVDRKIYLVLHTKEPSGRSANIHLAAKFENASIDDINMPVRSQDLKGTKTVFQFDFQEDLSIRFPTANMILKFTVKVVHAATGKKTTVEKEVRMRHKGRNTIQIARKKFFKPGQKYTIKARVKTLDGKPDNSLNHLSTTIKFVTKNNKIEEKSYQTNLKNGETVYSLQPKADTDKILISMEIADTKYSEEVSRFPGAKEYMVVSILTKSPQVGSKVKIKVDSTDEMEELHLVVFGSNGIVLHESFPDAIQKDVYEINLVVTNEMKPEARGLVFYSRLSDGALIYDEFSIGLGFSIENSLEIITDVTAEPDTKADIQVITEEGSLVYLVAINANSPQISRDNEVSRSAIYDEITHYLNEKYPMSSEYHFEKLNAFILEPLKNGTDCDLSTRSGIFDDENEEVAQRTKRSITSVQKLYPEVLPQVKYIATTSEAQTVKLDIPDITATWRIFGISVHPTKGFTVAKTQPEISVKGTVKNKLELELTGKTSIKQDEMHKIILTAVNVNPIDLRGTVYITAEDGNLHVGNEVPSGNKKCINQNKESRLQFPVNLTPQRNSMSGSFYISTNDLKQIKLKATFEGQITAETFKLIDVEDSLELKTIVIDNKLIESAHFDLIGLPFNTSSVPTFVGIHGNLLGPALEGLDVIFGQVMYLEEEKILKFATDVIICKYFDFIRDSYHPKAKVARERITENGPEIENILKNILKNKQNRKKHLLKLTFITGVLIDAFEYFDASRSTSEALAFIKSEQYYYSSIGKFDYDPEFDDHKDISPTVREYIQIALIVATMAKNSQYKRHYSNEINYSLNYLLEKSSKNTEIYKGDHLISMTAYAYALNGNQRNAEIFLKKLSHGYKKSNRFLKHYSMYVQALSYIILTKTLIRQDAKEQVEWLLKYRNADGAYFSPYDTVLALQALYEYTKFRNYSQRQYTLRTDGQDTYINPSESAKYPITDQNIKLQTYHQDLGYISLYQKYLDNKISKNIISSVETFVKKGRIANSLDITVDYAFKTTDRDLGNSIIVLEVDLPVGYKHYNPNQEVVGYKNDETTLVFHFNNKAKNKKYDKLITVVKDPNVEIYYKPLTIKFYDYYRPNIVDTYKYDVKCIIN